MMPYNVLYLDAGHAKNTPGKNNSKEGFYEWEFNNDMQYKIKKRVEEHGITVVLTNPNPATVKDIGLTQRANIANDHWARKGRPKSIFISLHANAFSSESARGTETFHAKNASLATKEFARVLQREVFSSIKGIDKEAKDRGVKIENFTVIYKASMPSVLVEYAFYSNLKDLKILKNNRNELVEATVKAVCVYFGIKYQPPKQNAPNTPSSNSKEVYYRVVASSFKDKNNADKLVTELKQKGYPAFIDIYEK